MKRISTYATITIYLEGYGQVEFREDTDGKWILDLEPSHFEHSDDKLYISVPMKGGGRYILPKNKVIVDNFSHSL